VGIISAEWGKHAMMKLEDLQVGSYDDTFDDDGRYNYNF